MLFYILLFLIAFIFVVVLIYSKGNLNKINVSVLKKKEDKYIIYIINFSKRIGYIYIDNISRKVYLSSDFINVFPIAFSYYYF
jgi:hypothetical protein